MAYAYPNDLGVRVGRLRHYKLSWSEKRACHRITTVLTLVRPIHYRVAKCAEFVMFTDTTPNQYMPDDHVSSMVTILAPVIKKRLAIEQCVKQFWYEDRNQTATHSLMMGHFLESPERFLQQLRERNRR